MGEGCLLRGGEGRREGRREEERGGERNKFEVMSRDFIPHRILNRGM